MIIVTGTRRSGTSVWMQILQRGGFQILGEAFPAHWKEVMEAANPRGFYESRLVQGINFLTNPEPQSGAWLPPEKVSKLAVKIFADGLVKTDFAYIGKVIFTIRRWQDCDASQRRLDEIKSAHPVAAEYDGNIERASRLPIGYTWWKANFSLIRDMQIRRYPTAAFSYDALLADPERIVTAAFEWLGGGNAIDAAAVVDKSLQTQKQVEPAGTTHDHSDVFDELYDTFHRNRSITPAVYERWLATDKQISAEIDSILGSSDIE